MGRISSCRGLPILDHGPDNSSDALHLIKRKPIPARKVAGRARRDNVPLNVRLVVIYAVKPAWVICGAAMSAGLTDKLNDFGNTQVARINSLVGFPKEDRATLNGFVVFLHNCTAAQFLFRRHCGPPFRSAVAPFLSCGVTFSALVGKAKRAGSIAQKVVSSSRHLLFTPMANAVTGLGAVVLSHARKCGGWTPLFQLPWKEYPGTTKGKK